MLKIIKQNSTKTSRWSGGSTTELFIYPENALFKMPSGDVGEFDFRISTATIEITRSQFSKLPGINRILMVLEGKLELHHLDHHSTILEPFETDHFNGDWETNSIGIANDFNVMIKHPQLSGIVKPFILSKKGMLPLNADKHGCVYIYKGTIVVNDNEVLQSGDAVYFNNETTVIITAQTTAQLIVAFIQ